MDTRQHLAGQVAVVTGAGRGIGAAIARRLAALGAASVLLGRTQSSLDQTARAIVDSGGTSEVIPCTICRPRSGTGFSIRTCAASITRSVASRP